MKEDAICMHFRASNVKGFDKKGCQQSMGADSDSREAKANSLNFFPRKQSKKLPQKHALLIKKLSLGH